MSALPNLRISTGILRQRPHPMAGSAHCGADHLLTGSRAAGEIYSPMDSWPARDTQFAQGVR